jgi:hypothetical protein
MDPDAALRAIDEAGRVDAETREVMAGLHGWLSRGGFAPNWDAYPTGTRRYRKAYGRPVGKRGHATKKAGDTKTSTVKLKDRYSGGHVWLTVRDGLVVGALGSDPKRYIGMPIDRARHVARYGGTGRARSAHAVVAAAPHGRESYGSIQIGDIVRRSDREDKNRYVVVNIHQPWIYTRRISGSGGPGVITFPSELMLRKVS